MVALATTFASPSGLGQALANMSGAKSVTAHLPNQIAAADVG
jgi:hypothetical protein